MSKLTKIKEMLQAALQQFAKISTDKGLLEYDGDELAVGSVIKMLDEEGNELAVEDGDYITDEGVTIVIAGGKVAELKDPEEKKDEPKEEPKSDEKMEEQKPVEEPEEEEEKPAEEPVEEEPKPEEEPAEPTEEEKFSAICKEKFESYAEKELRMVEAIRSLGVADCWVCEAGDGYAVINVWADGKSKYVKYDIAEDGDNLTASNPVEVVSKFVPVGQAEEFASQIEALNARIKELEEKPAAQPATEEFEEAQKVEKTGDKKLDNLRRIINA